MEVCSARGYLLEAGTGPTVVVLSSVLVLARSYLALIEHLARRRHVIVVEFPGSGRGSRLARAWSFERYARWTAGLLDRLDLRDVTLVGHSNSGPIATLLAAEKPSRVARLVLVGSVGGDLRFSLLRVLFGRAIDCFHEPMLTLTAWPHVLLNAVYHPRSFWNQVRLSARTDLREVLPRVPVPTLLAWGVHDHTMPPRCMDIFRQLLPHAGVCLSWHGSHDWLITHPLEFSKAAERFSSST